MTEAVSQQRAENTPGTIPEVDAYIASAAPFARPILQHIREAVHHAVPEVREVMKWSRPFFLYRGIILGNMAAFTRHCSLGLWGEQIAAALRADGVVSSEGMGSFGQIDSVDDLPRRSTLTKYLRLAAKAIETGERSHSIVRPKVARQPVAVPQELADALRQNPAAARHFAAMSPSCRQEYSQWIAEAKREETRQRRLANAIEWIAEGKSRNWKYERT